MLQYAYSQVNQQLCKLYMHNCRSVGNLINMQIDNWDDIRFFLAVYREGNISSAASFLSVNNTTVSRRIAALEERLQVKLFERHREGYTLTTHAEAVLQLAKEMETHALTFNRKLVGQDFQLKGTLRITLPDVFVYYLLNKYLSEFSQLYPEINLEIVSSDSPLNLNAREADLAFRFTDNPPQNLIGRRIGTADYAVYGSINFIKDNPVLDHPNTKALVWMDLDGRPLWLKQNFSKVQIGTRYDSIMGMVAGLRCGAGIAQIPCLVGEVDPLLVRIPTKFVEPGWGVWILHHVDLKQSSKVRVAYEYFSNVLIAEVENYSLGQLTND